MGWSHPDRLQEFKRCYTAQTMSLLEEKPYLREVSMRSTDMVDDAVYPFCIPSIKAMGKLQFHPDVTFFVGENGAGKSTLLEAIALSMGFGPEGGTKNAQFKTANTVSTLHEHLHTIKSFKQPRDGYFLRAESFYNVATYMDDIGYLDGYGGISLHERSHGESFMTLLTLKFRGTGLYLLDEPEAAPSPSRQLAALAAIHQLVQNRSQFIIATHSPILLSYPSAKIYQFDDSGIQQIAYEDTEHFAVTRDFLNHYPRRLEQLFADER